MATVYWNENGNQLTPITPADLVGVGDSVAYDALSVVFTNLVGGLLVANKTIDGVSGTPYMKLGYVDGSSITQNAKIWTDNTASNVLKFDLASATRLVITNSDILFNGASLLSGVLPIWSDTVVLLGAGGGGGEPPPPTEVNVISPTNSEDIFNIGGLIGGCVDLMQISDNATFGSDLIATSANINDLQPTTIVGYGFNVDASGNLTTPSLGIIGDLLQITCVNDGGNVKIGYSGSMTAGLNAVSIGNQSIVTGTNAVALNCYNVSGNNSVAIRSKVSGASVVAFGAWDVTRGINSLKVVGMGEGVYSDANSANAVLIGPQAEATNAASSVVIGNSVDGVHAASQATNTVCIGQGSGSLGNNTVVIGSRASASGVDAIAIGGGLNNYDNMTTVSGTHSLAVGINARAQGNEASTLGQNSKSEGDNSLALGYTAYAGQSATAIGKNSDAHEVSCVAIGTSAFAGFQKQIVLAVEDVQLSIREGIADFIDNTLKSPAILLANAATPTPVSGQMYFNGTHFYGYNGSTWKQLDN